jgi:hypothetical protein
MSDIDKEIEQMQAEINKRAAEIDRLNNLQKLFPDLKKYEGRWKKVVYYSKAANPIATEYESRHSCGCCSDSVLEIWPYAVTDYGRVHTDPPRFSVGERHYISGDKPYKGWKDDLSNAGIRPEVIESVNERFKNDRLERIQLASENDDDEDD